MDGDNAADLDNLIQSFEYENQQYVKCMERENQLIEALEKEIEVRRDQTERLQDDISKLDEDTKRAHKQFTHNRDNVDSLKKNIIVLKDHETALEKTLKNLVENGHSTRKERSGLIEHYRNIWKDYEAKYKSFPLAMKLEEKNEKVKSLQNQLQTTEQKVKSLQNEIQDFNSNNDGDFKNMKKLIIKIVEMKVGTTKVVHDIKNAYREKNRVKEEIRLAEKKQIVEAAKNGQQKSNEAMEIEEQRTNSDNSDSSTVISMISSDVEVEENNNKVTKSVEHQTGTLSHPLEQPVNVNKKPSFEERFARLSQEFTQPRHRDVNKENTQPRLRDANKEITQTRHTAVESVTRQTPTLETLSLQMSTKESTTPRQMPSEYITQYHPHVNTSEVCGQSNKAFKTPVVSVPQIAPLNRPFVPTIRPQVNRMTVPQITPQPNVRSVRPLTPQVVKHRPMTSQGLSYTTLEAPKASRLQIPTVSRPTITTFSSAEPVKTPSKAQPMHVIPEQANRASPSPIISTAIVSEKSCDGYDNLPKTPETFSIDNKEGDYSPFDIEKHKKRIQMLKKSPGDMMMESRPMYSAEKIDKSKEQDSGIFTGITTYSLFDNQASKNNNMMSGTEFSGLASELAMFTSGGGGEGGDVSSNTDNTASYNDKSNGDSFSGGGEKTANFFSCKSPDLGSSTSGFSFGGGGSSIMSLFGGAPSPSQDQSQSGEQGGSSFMSLFSSSENQDGGDSSGSIMSLFGGTDKKTQDSSFSFSFGGDSNETPPSRGFSLF